MGCHEAPSRAFRAVVLFHIMWIPLAFLQIQEYPLPVVKYAPMTNAGAFLAGS